MLLALLNVFSPCEPEFSSQLYDDFNGQFRQHTCHVSRGGKSNKNELCECLTTTLGAISRKMESKVYYRVRNG